MYEFHVDKYTIMFYDFNNNFLWKNQAIVIKNSYFW